MKLKENKWRVRASTSSVTKILYEFSEDLGPSDEFITHGNQFVNKIFEMLQQRSSFKLARPCISGSMGRKTSIMTSDYDLIIFVNGQQPLFTKVIKEWEFLLSKFPNVTEVKTSKFGVKFSYQGYSIDLLPATNHVNVHPIPPMERLAAEQALKVYKTIRQGRTKAEWHSSALCETQLRFMQQQSSFIHGLVRVSKFWEKSTFTFGYISGRSTLIELIAVSAGKQEENFAEKKLSMLRAFKNFLNLILNFNNMQITFPDFDPLESIRPYNFGKWKIDKNLKRPPYVIEPANPYNNIASGLRGHQIANLKHCAQITLGRLDKLVKNYYRWNNYSYSIIKDSNLNALDYIFTPAAEYVPVESKQIRNQLEYTNFHVWCTVYNVDEPGGFRCISTKKRWSDFDTPQWDSALKSMEKLFFVVAQSFVSDFARKNDYSGDLDELRTAVWNRMEKCIDENVWGNETQEEQWDAEDNWDCSDVLFKIPVEIPGDGGKICIWIRFDLDDE